MKKIKLLIFYFFWILFLPYNSEAQDVSVFFKNYTINNGLPSNHVTSITQDSAGYLWIGTVNGLSRFNGASFENFSSDKNHLPDNNVMSVSSDKQHGVWVSTFPYGISKYNYQTQQFKDCSSISVKKSLKYYTSRMVDSKGRIWLGSYNHEIQNQQGLFLCNNEGVPVKKYIFEDSAFQNNWYNSNKVMQILERTDGQFWISTWSDIILFNPETGAFKKIPYHEKINPRDNEFIKLSLVEDIYGNLWVGTWGHGLLCYRMKENRWEEYQLIPEKIFSGVRNIIHRVKIKSKNELWIGSENGFYIFNIQEKQFHRVVNQDKQIDKILRSTITDIFVDNNQNLWIGSATHGLIYLPYAQFLISEYQVKNINFEGKVGGSKVLYDKEFNCYIRLSLYCGVIHVYDRKTRKEKLFVPEKEVNLNLINYFDGLKIGHGRYLLLSNSDFFVLDLRRGTLNSARSISYKIPWRNGQTFDKVQFYNNEVVMLHPKGVLFYSPMVGKETEWLFKSGMHDTIYHHSTNFYIFGNKVWFFVNKTHVYCYEFQNNCLSYLYNFSMQSVQGYTDFLPISNREAYAVDFTHLYHIQNLNSKGNVRIKTMSPDVGVPYQNMNSLVKVGQDLWINNVINSLKFNLTNKEFVYYNDELFLPNLNCVVSPINELKELAFAYDYGFKIIQEENLPWKSNSINKIVWNNFLVHNKPFYSGDINYFKEISLKYNQNFISINFSALNFNQSKQTKYYYQLEGLEDQWNLANNQNQAVYTSLPPGEYRLLVLAKDPAFQWKSSIQSIPIIILPPFYQTWWFYMLLIIFSFVIIYIIFKWRVNKFKEKEKLKADFDKKVSEIEMSALRAQMNPHFIFNCLNSINSYIVKNDSVKASQYLTKFSKLIRLILDNSRQSIISLKNELDTLKLYIEMERLRFNNQFNYQIIVDNDIDQEIIQIPPMIIQPFVENAIWHGLMPKNDDGEIYIKCSIVNNGLCVIIEDNGIGRLKSSQISSKNLEKKSYGLDITMERIKQTFPNSVLILEDLNPLIDHTGTRIKLILNMHL